ncbi:MAG: amino acid adenylation domain-containing protein [Caldilineaceae bacterium]
MIYLLPQIIEEAARRHPNKEAFRFRDQSLTYAQLLQRVNQLANTLIACGVRRGDRVGIYTPKSLECAVAIFGIMQAGAAYVPLDPTAPVDRVRFMLANCGIRCLISHAVKRGALRQIGEAGIGLSHVIGMAQQGDLPFAMISWADIDKMPDIAPAVTAMEQDLAYIIYTSGSTGEPKGIMHTHQSGLSYARMAADLYGVTSADRLSNFPPLHFDQSTFDYFSGPLMGSTTVIIPDEVRMLPASLTQLVQDERLTIWYSVPFALIQMLLRGAMAQRDLNSLRWVIYGGEPFPHKHLQALMDRLPHARFSNNYGPAEVNQCSYFNMPPLPAAKEGALPIGRICANMEGLVLDENEQPLPPGEVGELAVRTPTMMQGYWARPDLNAKAFYWRSKDGGGLDRFYRTGDLVQQRADGNYLFLGRKDRQIKVRGYRIELDEVEAAILTHANVEETAVFPVANDDGETSLKAMLILKNGSQFNKTDLLRHLVERLPRYALPSQIDIVSDFPRTTSGKIDRRALQNM